MNDGITFTIIFTKQDNTTVEMDIDAPHDVDAAKKAQSILADNDYKSWEFADNSASAIGVM